MLRPYVPHGTKKIGKVRYERKDRVTKLSYLAARPSLAFRTLHVFIPFFFARPTDPPSREGGRWETKHFIGMASSNRQGQQDER